MYTFCFNSVLISNTFLFFVKKNPPKVHTKYFFLDFLSVKLD